MITAYHFLICEGLENFSVLCYNGRNKNPPRVGACGSCEVALEVSDLRSDHNLDHLQVWTTRELWTLWHEKARVSDKKARKSTQNEAKNRCFCVWELDAAGSSPVTSTISILNFRNNSVWRFLVSNISS